MKLLFIECASLGHQFAQENIGDDLLGMPLMKLKPIFPDVTCTVQATLKTGKPPSDHGIICNGYFNRELRKTYFWEQSSQLISGERWFQQGRKTGKTVGITFVQQSLGEEVDIVFSPQPIHKHHGGMIFDSLTLPSELKESLRSRLGKFPLFKYWGPLAGIQSSRWIALSTSIILEEYSPDLFFTYIPHLDYALQKFGTQHNKSRKSAIEFRDLVLPMLREAKELGYKIILFGDSAIEDVKGVLYPNKILAEHGFLKLRNIEGMLYPDFFYTPAFALCDHQISHVYCNPSCIETLAEVFENTKGIEEVFTGNAINMAGLNHQKSGEIILKAAQGMWFAYSWWDRKSQKPEYASHMDIHNKPGFDPAELFFGFPPPSTCTDFSKVKGTHGAGRNPLALYSDLIDKDTDLYSMINEVALKWMA
ncbi:alkaline phosphatase family protein [bacterium]|nr:alkaline phosphatase family protein [bacterium]